MSSTTSEKYAERRPGNSDAETGQIGVSAAPVYDDVFGEIGDGAPNYRSVSALGSFVLMTKANLGLGVLSIPMVFQVLGIVPGILIILGVQGIITYCATMIGPFKTRHPEVYGLGDAAYVFGGRIAKEIFFVLFWVEMIMVTSGATVGVATALNAVSAHGACTAVFMVVACVAGILLGSIRTIGNLTWIGWVGLTSLMVAIITLTVAVGVQSRPAMAPENWVKDVKVFGNPTFPQAMNAVSSVIFSYGSTPTYFPIVSEMRDPRKYVRAVTTSLCLLTAVYLILGGVVYHYCAQYVATPALGSAGPLMKKVCYGLAIPALLASLAIFVHISAKHIFVRIMSSTKRLKAHLASNSWQHWFIWLACVIVGSLLGYVVASAIPNFGTIIALIGSLVVPPTAIIPLTLMWWHDNFRFVPSAQRTLRLWALFVFNMLILLLGAFLTVGGVYGAVMDIIATSSSTGPWSCADNSNSVPSS